MRISLGANVELELILVRRGRFIMGSENQLFSESPPHAVCFRADFLLGKYPVTQSQWEAVMGANPSAFCNSPNLPVDSVSWDQALEFCDRLSERSGNRVRLPSEAEWEYACRAGTQNDFFFGPWGPFLDETEIPSAARSVLFDFAWFDLNSRDRTHPVGLKQPNAWGFYDMIGNVWEWCADVWHSGYGGAPGDGSPWLDDAAQPRRCLRGGAWDMNAFRCRSSYRSYDHKELPTSRFGFRIAADAELSPAAGPLSRNTSLPPG
jgi:formylglycine-generating enzyme required for sulfatase activity